MRVFMGGEILKEKKRLILVGGQKGGVGKSTFSRILLDSLRRRGRHVQIGLTLAEQARPAVPMDRIVAWELQVPSAESPQAFLATR